MNGLAKIRPMQQADIDRVYEIEKTAHRAPWSRNILSDCVLVGYDCRVLISEDKQIEGYVICRNSERICHILNLCVAISAQRKGYGESLLKAVLASLAKTDFDAVTLEVRPSNAAALALYEKFGFYKDTIKKDYYQDSEGKEDAILLKREIN